MSLRAAELVVELAIEAFPNWTPKVGRPPKLDVVEALRLCLCWLRRNITFEELGEDFGIGTTTAWEYAHGMAEFLAKLIGCLWVPNRSSTVLTCGITNQWPVGAE